MAQLLLAAHVSTTIASHAARRANPLRDFLPPLGKEAVDDHPGPFLGEPLRAGPSDTGGRAGDDGHTIGESVLGFSSLR